MEPRGALGPEAAILSARMAEFRALRAYGRLELPHETPMYVEVALRTPLRAARGVRSSRLRRDAGRLADRLASVLHAMGLRAAGRREASWVPPETRMPELPWGAYPALSREEEQ